MPAPSPRSNVEYVVPAVLAAVIVALLWFFTPLTEYNRGRDYDGVYYAAIAENINQLLYRTSPADWSQSFSPEILRRPPPILVRTAPWCWRVLTPFLAGVLPFDPVRAFSMWGMLSCWINLFLFYWICRKEGLSLQAAYWSMFMYVGVFWSVKFSAYSPCYIDHQSQTFALVGLYLMQRRFFGALLFLMPIAVLQKESAIFLAPVFFAYYRHSGGEGRRAKLYLICLLASGLMVAGVLRMLIVPVNIYSPEAVLRIVFTTQIVNPFFWPRLFLAVFSGTGLIFPCLILRLSSARSVLESRPHWAVLIAVGLIHLLAGGDKERLFLFMLPGLVVVMAMLWDEFFRRGRTLLWGGLTLLLHAYLGGHFSSMSRHAEVLCRLLPVHCLESLYPGFIRVLTVLIIWLTLTRLLKPDEPERRICCAGSRASRQEQAD